MLEGLNDQQLGLLRLAAVAAGAALLSCWLGRAPAPKLLFGAKTLEQERARFLERLQEATRRFFVISMSIQKVAKRARTNIEASGVEVTDTQIRALLADQCQVREQLRKVIVEVLECTSEEFHEVQLRHREPELVVYLEGFEAMLQCALGGLPPILPNARVPERLTEDLALQILGEAFTLELEKIVKRLGGQQITQQELAEILSSVHREACLEALAVRLPELDGRKDAFEVFYSALGMYMSHDGFAEKRREIDEVHQRHQARIFSRPAPPAEAGAEAAEAAEAKA